jgi:heat-inducible transcriptional repressor
MEELTDRQTKILKTIVEDYIDSGQPVGSQSIEKKYELGVSPATIRNEMAELAEKGLLKQPHTSAGRVPTRQAFKFYVNQLMEEKKLSVADEVAAKEKIWDSRFEYKKLMHEATRALADAAHSLAVSVTNENDLFHAGYAYILEMPEFYDIDVTRTILAMIDRADRMQNLFGKSFDEESVHLLLGEELGDDYLEPCGMVFSHFKAGQRSGSLGVIGPNRLDYPRIIPTINYFTGLIEELVVNL